MNSREIFEPQTVLSAVAATGAGNYIRTESARHKLLRVSTSGMGAGDSIVVKVQASDAETAPDFDSASSLTNPWEYVDCKSLEDTSDVDGDGGIIINDADDTRRFEVNDNGARWITCNVTTLSDTSNTTVTATLSLFND